MRSRLVLVAVIVLVAIVAIWMMRRPAIPSAVVSPAPVQAPAARVITPTSIAIIPKQPELPTIPKQIQKPQKRMAPKTIAMPVVVAPVVPVPATPPRRMIPVTPVVETLPQEWKGNNDSAIQHQGQVIIQSEKQWFQFWLEHHPGEGAPEVDFSKSMVVGVFLGVRPSDGFFVNIVNVHPDKNNMVVDYVQQDPPTGTFQVGVTAYPYDIKVIPRSPLKVTFQQLTPQDKR